MKGHAFTSRHIRQMRKDSSRHFPRLLGRLNGHDIYEDRDDVGGHLFYTCGTSYPDAASAIRATRKEHER